MHLYCACYCKDTHFEAIHNKNGVRNLLKGIVLATAKIHILKQFTTPLAQKTFMARLCLLLQRYTFWSNSQQIPWYSFEFAYCACYCKDTHFEAIHNAEHIRPLKDNIVLATAKIHILKQFTTRRESGRLSAELCLLLQRYTFWSNSQQRWCCSCWWNNCACYCKDTHFEAIHNTFGVTLSRTQIVLATAKIHILKQFTTSACRYTPWQKLCLLLQRYTFWSNSQRFCSFTFQNVNCACYCKDTHFEAIHNCNVGEKVFIWIVLATAKIHILKQFTTTRQSRARRRKLCLLLQRYTFWSNSQRLGATLPTLSYCACYCKDTHFEAIHNTKLTIDESCEIVLATAKIHILKQFTTSEKSLPPTPVLCLLLQRYTFWSNSQLQVRRNHHLRIVLATAKIHILKAQ